MQFLKDLISSFYKNIDARVNSPILGTLSAVFVILHWDKFTLLFLGSGTIDARVENFKLFLNEITAFDYFLLTVLMLAYLFALPVANYLIELLLGAIEQVRYRFSINQKVDREKERARLINSKYKAEHESEIAAQEIIEEIAFSNEKIEQQKLLTEDIRQRSKSAHEIIQSMLEKSKKIKLDLDFSVKKNQEIEIKLQRDIMVKDREKLSYDKLKYQVDEKKKLSQISSAFYLVNELDLLLKADSIKISLSGLGSIISNFFGYTSFSNLLEDENFDMESLEAVDYIIYSEDLISNITSVIEEENLDEDIESYTFFEFLQTILEDRFGIKILTIEEVSEKIRDELGERGAYDLINHDEVSSSIAETNAYFDYVEDLHILSFELTEESLNVNFECVLSGTTHEDKPYCGDEIDINFTTKSEVILGKYAVGGSEIEDVQSSVKDYHEDDYDPEEHIGAVDENSNEF